jgi:hypothetical protein
VQVREGPPSLIFKEPSSPSIVLPQPLMKGFTMEQTNWPNQTGKPLNPDPNAFKDDPSPGSVDHAAVGDGGTNQFEGSGKDMGLVKPPIVSMHRTSGEQSEDTEAKEFKIIDNANFKLNHHIHKDGHYKFNYPFEDLIVGQGISIPIPKNSTTDKFMIHMHKQINQYVKQNSEVERDEDGDDVMEDVAINKKKRNGDGTIQLDGDTPRLGIKSGFRPKLIGPTFTVKAVVKGDELAEGTEADKDGVLIIRMS